jgi:hypothetical protein
MAKQGRTPAMGNRPPDLATWLQCRCRLGVWAKEERDLCRMSAREVGARVVLCLLDPPLDELSRRLSLRNAQLPVGTFEISQEDLLRWSKLFQRPSDEELALYDPLESDAGA